MIAYISINVISNHTLRRIKMKELIKSGTYRNWQTRTIYQWEITKEEGQLFFTLQGVARHAITEKQAEILIETQTQ